MNKSVRRIQRTIATLNMLFLIFNLVGAYPTFAFQTDEHPVTAMSWSPDSTRLAIGYDNGKVNITSNTGQVTATSEVSGVVASIQWSPAKGQPKLAVASLDGFIVLLDSDTGQSLGSIPSGTELFALAWSPDGTLLASASKVGSGLAGRDIITIMDVATGNLVRSILTFNDTIFALAWHPTNNTLLASAAGENVTIWDVTTGESLFGLQMPPPEIIDEDFPDEVIVHAPWSIGWNADGSKFAAASLGLVRVWDAQTQEVITTFRGQSIIRDLAWSPNSDELIIAEGNTVQFLRLESNTLVRFDNIQSSSDVTVAAWSPDGNRIAYGGSDSTTQISIAPNAII